MKTASSYNPLAPTVLISRRQFRTYNHPLRRQVLYPLSYARMLCYDDTASITIARALMASTCDMPPEMRTT